MLSVLFHSAQDETMWARKIHFKTHPSGWEPKRSEKSGVIHMQKSNKYLNYQLLLQLSSGRACKTKHYQAHLFPVKDLTKLQSYHLWTLHFDWDFTLISTVMEQSVKTWLQVSTGCVAQCHLTIQLAKHMQGGPPSCQCQVSQPSLNHW